MVTDTDSLDYFQSDKVLEHYARAAANIGLWRSEELIFLKYLSLSDRILELGTGAGRIAFGLYELGFRHLLATDFAKEMIQRARNFSHILDYHIPFKTCDARALPFEDGMFDACIFGFNGLMQIPGKEGRLQAMREIRRMLRRDGIFIFTSHDRSLQKYLPYWEEQAKLWQLGKQDPALLDFGDIFRDDTYGKIYIHIPSREEVLDMLYHSGFELVFDSLRAHIANEPPDIREFADECRFWVVRAC